MQRHSSVDQSFVGNKWLALQPIENGNGFQYDGDMYTTHTRCSSDSCRHNPAEIWDMFGMLAGVVCLIHCLLLPTVLSMLPTLAVIHLGHDSTHVLLFSWVVLFSLSILLGYKKHRQKNVLSLMLIGLCLVMTATFHHALGFSETLELPIITLGNLILVLAHFMNRRIAKQLHA